jgi:disulfide bond formation protein DsbB
MATLVATVATGGCLYLSLGLGLIPCDLCWYQRILMYPLVVVLGVATLEERPGAARTAFPFVIGGTAIAGYHTYLQVSHTAASYTVGGCGSIQYALLGGLLTIPRLSLLAFVMIGVLLVFVSNLVSLSRGRSEAVQQ